MVPTFLQPVTDKPQLPRSEVTSLEKSAVIIKKNGEITANFILLRHLDFPAGKPCVCYLDNHSFSLGTNNTSEAHRENIYRSRIVFKKKKKKLRAFHSVISHSVATSCNLCCQCETAAAPRKQRSGSEASNTMNEDGVVTPSLGVDVVELLVWPWLG